VIVGSLLLILIAVATLGLGLVRGSNVLLVGSIAASLLAAIALVIGARRSAAARAAADDQFDDGLDVDGDEPAPHGAEEFLDTPMDLAREAGRRRESGTVYGRDGMDVTAVTGRVTETLVEDEPVRGVSIPSQSPVNGRSMLDAEVIEDDDLADEDPPDEPAPQFVLAADAARVAQMTADVLVIDGRPRYHQAGCVHLLGRESEPVPVGEAVELGFTPCSLCEPDSVLLAEARRV
jgi:hypothetical protein